MKRSAPTLLLFLAAAAAAVVTGASARAATVASPSPVLPSWGDFPGAPPPFEVPAGGTEETDRSGGAFLLTILRADGSVLARAAGSAEAFDEVTYFGSDGSALVSVAASRAGRGRARATTFASCGSPGYAAGPYRWLAAQEWWLVAASVPTYVSLTLTEQNLQNAHTEWEANTNYCGIADESTLTFSYRGRIAAPFGYNGYSTIGWGEVDQLGGVCVGAVACTTTWYSGAGAVESDTRMDVNPAGGCAGTRWYWVNGDTDCRLDIWDVYAHELGHTVGFDHYDERSLVMYPFVFVHDVLNRRLGRGDALGNNAKY